eukprot:TRINITY_DN29752_c0_g1_i1.p1 TRINITY_DN29752_c0_g1~~TRINITY_DN29752_c0_g1_i1.p1  ORF type:complete len:288 (+),score=17.77 TRINITY_DN29752_c0_g1_i1:99-962(+)
MATLRETTSILMAAQYTSEDVTTVAYSPISQTSARHTSAKIRPFNPQRLAAISCLFTFTIIGLLFIVVLSRPEALNKHRNRRLLTATQVKTTQTSLVSAGIIPNVLEDFNASIMLSVVFRGQRVSNGMELTERETAPNAVGEKPIITVYGSTASLYTVVMADPDAPDPTNPSEAEYLSWLFINVPGETKLGSGEGLEIERYQPPDPPTGQHRYVIAVFLQPFELLDVPAPASRRNFNTTEFAHTYGLGKAVAATYFLTKKDLNGPAAADNCMGAQVLTFPCNETALD